MNFGDRMAALESRVTHLESLAKSSAGALDAAALAAMKDELRKTAPALGPDAQRVIIRLHKSAAALDAVLAKCAANDALRYTPARPASP